MSMRDNIEILIAYSTNVSKFLDRSNTFGLIDAGHHVFKPAAPGTLCHSDEIIRSPDIHVGRLRFYHGFFFLLSSFLRHVSELAKRNSTEIGHMLGSKCDLKNACPKSGAYFSPTNRWGGAKHLFRRLRNLTATLMAYIFGIKHDTDNRQMRWQLQGVFYIVPKYHEL